MRPVASSLNFNDNNSSANCALNMGRFGSTTSVRMSASVTTASVLMAKRPHDFRRSMSFRLSRGFARSWLTSGLLFWPVLGVKLNDPFSSVPDSDELALAPCVTDLKHALEMTVTHPLRSELDEVIREF